MRRAIPILTAVAGLLISTTAQAGIGWTLSECSQHYAEPDGGPVSMDNSVPNRFCYTFYCAGYKITVLLLDGKVSNVGYTNTTEERLSPEQVNKLLSVNIPVPGAVWDNKYTITDYAHHG
jgi:hypothetical protein